METKMQTKKCECRKTYKNPKLKIYDIGVADVILCSGGPSPCEAVCTYPDGCSLYS